MTPTGGFWIPHTRCRRCSLLPLPWAGCLWPGLGTRQACSWAQLHGEVGEWGGGLQQAPQLLPERHCHWPYTSFWNSSKSAMSPWADGGSGPCRPGGTATVMVALSEFCYICDLQHFYFYFKIQFSVTNPLLFISCTFWPFYVNKTTKPQRLRIRLLETGLKRLPKM